jgi:hypothetical protein
MVDRTQSCVPSSVAVRSLTHCRSPAARARQTIAPRARGARQRGPVPSGAAAVGRLSLPPDARCHRATRKVTRVSWPLSGGTVE